MSMEALIALTEKRILPQRFIETQICNSNLNPETNTVWIQWRNLRKISILSFSQRI